MCWFTRWSVLLVLTVPLFTATPVWAQSQADPIATVTVVKGRSPQSLPPSTLLQTLAQANVIYLGETHDSPADHQAQLAILQSLDRLHPDWAIGLEMFQRPFQSVLDRYLAGKLTETELQNQTQYQKRWGFPWEFYAALLRLAQQRQRRVIALNTPSEVTRKVARNGLDSLNWSDRRFIPPRSEMRLEPETYRQRLRQIYDEAHQGKGNSDSFARFFQAQVLWDETMAERIAQFHRQYPDTLLVVIVGQGHLLYGEGIPQRVSRRLVAAFPHFQQISVLLNPPAEIRNQPGVADYFWDAAGAGNK